MSGREQFNYGKNIQKVFLDIFIFIISIFYSSGSWKWATYSSRALFHHRLEQELQKLKKVVERTERIVEYYLKDNDK